MINNVSGSESTEENKKYTRYTDIYYYYYWTITTQSTSYTWTITGTYINGDSAGALTNYSKTTENIKDIKNRMENNNLSKFSLFFLLIINLS